jgi:hypothetical protein
LDGLGTTAVAEFGAWRLFSTMTKISHAAYLSLSEIKSGHSDGVTAENWSRKNAPDGLNGNVTFGPCRARPLALILHNDQNQVHRLPLPSRNHPTSDLAGLVTSLAVPLAVR